MKDVKAVLNADSAWPTKAGEYRFDGDTTRIIFGCPCGCGARLSVKISVDGESPGVWAWNGDREKPTVTPSIRRIGDCEWHGYLTRGFFKSV